MLNVPDVFYLTNRFLQRLSELIGAGSGLHAAVNAFYAGDHIFDLHALYKSADAFQIAIAAADELEVLYNAVLNIKEDPLRTGTLGFVIVLHKYILLSKIILNLQAVRPQARQVGQAEGSFGDL